MTRGGARPGAGRPRRACAQATPDDVPRARPGPYMTDAEWAPVAALAEQASIPVTDAMRRLIFAGAASPADGVRICSKCLMKGGSDVG